jgi:hypothetical protein
MGMSLRQSIGSVSALLAASLTATSLAAVAAIAAENGPAIPCEALDSVGVARMSGDGTITLRIRAVWHQPVVEGPLVYAPGDPQYADIKRHLGGIAPGESKPVPPLCGMNSEP